MPNAEPTISYNWHPLADLSASESALVSTELAALAGVWAETRAELESLEGYREFLTKLTREWSIETGIIERLYTLDRGITQTLIERGLEASHIPHVAGERPPGLVIAMIRDHHAVIEGLFAFVTGDRELSTSYLKQLHETLTAHQHTTAAVNQFGRQREVPLLRGAFKKLPNNPIRDDGSIHEYCPPEHVDSEMDRLLALHMEHEAKNVPPEIEAAWLHHRFSQIHPFQDGNGRIARCLATLVLLKASWFPLVVHGDDRGRYIEALEAADHGDLALLVDLFVAIQKRAFVNALGIVREVAPRDRVTDVIAAAKVALERRAEELRDAQRQVFQTADRLMEFAIGRLGDVREDLVDAIRVAQPNGNVHVDSKPRQSHDHHFVRHQVIETARALGYFANLPMHQASTRLVIDAPPDPRVEVLIALHAVGQEFRGVVAAVACFYRREQSPDGGSIVDLAPLASEPFLFGYTEPEADTEARFVPWLESVLTAGLEAWRSGL